MTKRWNVRGIGRGVLAALALSLVMAGGAIEGHAEARIDLNQASVDELTSLPGIGPARARAIVERRNEEPFETADELVEVPGIGEALLEKIRDQIEVGSSERSSEGRKRS